MSTHTTPVNRQAAIFLTRRKRIETVKEALEKLSEQLLQQEVSDNIIKMLSERKPGESPSLVIKIVIHRDEKTADQFTVKLRTQICTEMSGEIYYSLR